jgi:hypothetical protein
MYALKVKINDQAVVIGGADDLGVLSAILTCTGKLGPLSVRSRSDETQDFSFRLGGLTSRSKGEVDEHLVWLQNDTLKVGDTVTLQIIEVDVADPVISGEETQQREDDEREYFNHCKRAYFEMRDKYENES